VNVRKRRRRSFFERAHRHTPLLAVDSDDGLRFLVPTWDQTIGKKLYVTGRRREMDFLRSALEILRAHGQEPGGIFVDVGANIGTTCLPALVRGFESAVAIEPSHTNVRLLEANAALNGLGSRVRVIEAAASRSGGTGTLRVHPRNSGGHKLVRGGDGDPVELVRLVDVVDDPALIWIDVERHEHDVLAGAGDFVGRVPIVVELAAGRDDQTAELFGRYSAAFDLRRGAARIEGTSTGQKTDVLLLP
jgi:FkbM family methyltransferase